MSNWNRRLDFEEAVNKDHGIEAIVEQYWETSTRYMNRITYNGKEVILREQLDHGLTKFVNLIIGDNCEVFKNYKEADDKAFEYLKG